MKNYMLIVLLPSLVGMVTALIIANNEVQSTIDIMNNVPPLGDILGYVVIAYFLIGTIYAFVGFLNKIMDKSSELLPDIGTKLGGIAKNREKERKREKSEKELIRLKNLLDMGILSQDEFDAKAKVLKQDILS